MLYVEQRPAPPTRFGNYVENLPFITEMALIMPNKHIFYEVFICQKHVSIPSEFG